MFIVAVYGEKLLLFLTSMHKAFSHIAVKTEPKSQRTCLNSLLIINRMIFIHFWFPIHFNIFSGQYSVYTLHIVINNNNLLGWTPNTFDDIPFSIIIYSDSNGNTSECILNIKTRFEGFGNFRYPRI